MKVVIAVAAALALSACVTSQAAAPHVTVSAPPRILRVGQEWQAIVRVTRGRPAAFVIVQGRSTRRFPLVRAGRGYRAFASFPRPGRWRYGVRFGRRNTLVGTVSVRRAVPVLQQPYGIVQEDGGTLLVADFRGNAVFRLDPRTGEGSVVDRIPQPRDLRRAPNGRVLVASRTRILELASRAVVFDAGVFVGGFALAADGTMYVNEDGTRIARVRNGVRELLATGLDGVHGILAVPDGVLACESFAGNVRLIDGSGMRTVARGLGNPSYAAEAPGGFYVTEFSAGRLSLLTRSGDVTPIASVASPGPVALDASSRPLVGTIDGRIVRVEPATRRVTQLWPRR